MKVRYVDPYYNSYDIWVFFPEKHYSHYDGVIVSIKRGLRENIQNYDIGSRIFVVKRVCHLNLL